MTLIEHTVSARAGLIGNPSDGYDGKTIAVPVRNFYATVRLWERPDRIILPGDENEFDSIKHLFDYTSTNGFYDGSRLVKAATTVFFEYLLSMNKDYNGKKFEIDINTNIPRMVGLAGSSGIITGTMKCLQDFYDVKINPEILANLILRSETEKLGIAAGLQDRVVQAFDDLVYMDFSKEAFEKNNNEYGCYEKLDINNLPNLYLMYNLDPSDSGKVHSNITSLYFNSNPSISNPVKKIMKKFARLTDEFKEALLKKDFKKCSWLQNKNFDLRKELLGEDGIGTGNLEMVNIAREHGCSAKFSGSGGAVVGIYPNELCFEKIREKIKNRPYELVKVEI